MERSRCDRVERATLKATGWTHRGFPSLSWNHQMAAAWSDGGTSKTNVEEGPERLEQGAAASFWRGKQGPGVPNARASQPTDKSIARTQGTATTTTATGPINEKWKTDNNPECGALKL
ncbi:uncharacterized protein SPSK_04668 [Sporothrix schenckii 1099-18]|uniref:Uncharacterized protein n=1 Tax=Sporothrix schenckii 1099-18 TaxID=1397361 RepID=A0A0F2M193_SPOSC|nr:uncharacterized protein SPSK_04668 [Sporothrix schenckii 1099-18]KJR83467.1 hypothetical protein SPSK_04668 [Sporothrix schenckii 1099-18]